MTDTKPKIQSGSPAKNAGSSLTLHVDTRADGNPVYHVLQVLNALSPAPGDALDAATAQLYVSDPNWNVTVVGDDYFEQE